MPDAGTTAWAWSVGDLFRLLPFLRLLPFDWRLRSLSTGPLIEAEGKWRDLLSPLIRKQHSAASQNLLHMQTIEATRISGPAKAGISHFTAKRGWRHAACFAGAALLALGLGGCNGKKTAASNVNFQRAINAYFYTGRDECLFPTAYKFPNEVKVGEKDEMKSMDALSKAGLLTRTEDGAFKLVRYALTPLGTRATGRFCYGHRDVTSVDSFTPLHAVEGRKATEVTYHYRMVDVPVWAQDAGIQKAFPEMARKIGGNAEGKTTVMSAYEGWEVPDYGKPVIE